MTNNEHRRSARPLAFVLTFACFGAALACVGEDPTPSNPLPVDNDAALISSGNPSQNAASSSSGGSTTSGGLDASSNEDALDASSGALVCPTPEPPIIGAATVAPCGAPDALPEEQQVLYEEKPATPPTARGGSIAPGVYKVVRAFTSGAQKPTGTSGFWIFRDDGVFARSQTDYNVPQQSNMDLTKYGKGTWTATDSSLALSFSCRNQAFQVATDNYSYTAYAEGCEDYVEIPGYLILQRQHVE